MHHICTYSHSPGSGTLLKNLYLLRRMLRRQQIWTVLVGMLLLSACTEVYFTETQPVGKRPLTEFPPEVQGWFIDDQEGDTVHIRSRGFDLTEESGDLSDTLVLTKMKNLYFLNIQNTENNLWEVYIIEPLNPFEFHVHSIDGENDSTMTAIRAILSVKQEENDDGSVAHFILSPTSKEFKKLLKSGVFSNTIVFRRRR